ncbi:hypothetical protein MCOR30_010196 [Pyricularia oryzae]|uniref:Cytochrome P450 n=1 Tax=Pyricularia grisea TaxID=148305 RepID=A0ABQ8N7H3_PYRGI|nr:hypothetical protein MCOR33_010800 [Pyricularia grisea]KAI6313686.1 hypothetical protein MCOR30_010196 [Pyricularia oryzae]
MAHSTVSLALAAVGIFTLYLISKVILKTWQNATEARRLGCKPPAPFPSWCPFGLDIVRKLIISRRQMRTPEWLREQLAKTSTPANPNNLTCSFQIVHTSGILTADEVNVHAMLSKQFDDFEVGQTRREIARPLVGESIFTTDGHAWKMLRGLVRPSFARHQVGDLELDEKHVKNMMACLGTGSDGWTGNIDLQTLMFRYSLDSSTEFLCGASVGSQLKELQLQNGKATDDEDEIDFASALDRAMEGLATRGQFFECGPYIWPRGFEKACRDCHAFIDKYVARRQNKTLAAAEKQPPAESPPAAKEKYIFLDALAESFPDPVELRHQILGVLFAGRDTTASLISWVFYNLARDPARCHKLRRVVLEHFGGPREEEEEDPGRAVTFESLKECRYLQHVINETARLCPVVPVNSRRARRNTTLPRGGGPDGQSKVFVKEGTLVYFAPYIMGRRKELWGEDAERFVPERWEGKRHGWEFIPFSGGPRICPGQQSALTKTAYVIVRLLQRFDRIESWDPEVDVKHDATATMCSGTGVKVRLHADGF